jgi:hypothetical protein
MRRSTILAVLLGLLVAAVSLPEAAADELAGCRS